MKYAAAMRFGGELVDAIDCDYEDYKYLGLLCPECKDPVFLRAAGVRLQNGKEVNVGAHFCHFQSKDPAIALQCENRVAKYDKAELERRAKQAKGQRLKLLQRWFLDIIKTSPSLAAADEMNNMLESLIGVRNYLALTKAMHYAYRFHLNDTKEVLVSAIIDDFDSQVLNPDWPKSIQDRCLTLASKVDRNMHFLILKEVLDFLAFSRNLPLFQVVFAASCINSVIDLQSTHKTQSVCYMPETMENFVHFTKNFVGNLLVVLWADEFAKLEKSSVNSVR